MIKLRFVLGRGWASSAIAIFSAGHLSHVDAIMPDGTLFGARSDNIGGAPGVEWSGVRTRPNPYEAVAKVVTFEIPAAPDQERAFYSFLKKQDGKCYDHLAIVAFAFNRNWRDDDAWYCSELQAAALEDAAILTKTLFLSANKITPVMLATLVSEIPGTRQAA